MVLYGEKANGSESVPAVPQASLCDCRHDPEDDQKR